MATENQAATPDDAIIDELLNGSAQSEAEVVAPDVFGAKRWVPGKCVQCGNDLDENRVCEACDYDEKNKVF